MNLELTRRMRMSLFVLFFALSGRRLHADDNRRIVVGTWEIGSYKSLDVNNSKTSSSAFDAQQFMVSNKNVLSLRADTFQDLAREGQSSLSRPPVTIGSSTGTVGGASPRQYYYRFATDIQIAIDDSKRPLSDGEMDALVQILAGIPTRDLKGITRISVGINQVSPEISWDLAGGQLSINLFPPFGKDLRNVALPLLEAIGAHAFLQGSTQLQEDWRNRVGQQNLTLSELADRFGQLYATWVQDTPFSLSELEGGYGPWIQDRLLIASQFTIPETGFIKTYPPGKPDQATSIPAYRTPDYLRIGSTFLKLDGTTAVGWAILDPSANPDSIPAHFTSYTSSIPLPQSIFDGFPLRAKA